MKMQGLSSALLCLAALVVLISASATSLPGNKAIWAKKGVVFPAGCGDDRNPCKPLRIPSPDGNSSVEVTYQTDLEYPEVEVASLAVITLGRNLGKVHLVGSVDDEVVWSPDSKAFFINGNDNGYGDDHLAVHQLDDPNLGPGYITRQVEQDMVRSFPPCRAKDPINNCAQLAAKPHDYLGFVGLDWIDGSAGIVVMAEVPCSSSMGGIMCQVLGYEVEVPSGRILRRMEPKEFAKRWQHSMAWKFRDPGPPEFRDK